MEGAGKSSRRETRSSFLLFPPHLPTATVSSTAKRGSPGKPAWGWQEKEGRFLSNRSGFFGVWLEAVSGAWMSKPCSHFLDTKPRRGHVKLLWAGWRAWDGGRGGPLCNIGVSGEERGGAQAVCPFLGSPFYARSGLFCPLPKATA